MLRLHLLTAWLLSPVLGLLTRERDEPMPSSEPPLVETPARWEEFYRELSRARRHERSFSIARIPLAADGAPSSGPRSVSALQRPPLRATAGGGVERQSRAIDSLRHAVRFTDHVWADGGSAYVLMPETDRAEAAVVLPRVTDDELVPHDGVTVASFPEDGVTSGAVLAALLRPDEASAEVTAIDGARPTAVAAPGEARRAG